MICASKCVQERSVLLSNQVEFKMYFMLPYILGMDCHLVAPPVAVILSSYNNIDIRNL